MRRKVSAELDQAVHLPVADDDLAHARGGAGWCVILVQEWRDSNPQPPVLETGALPLSYTPKQKVTATAWCESG